MRFSAVDDTTKIQISKWASSSNGVIFRSVKLFDWNQLMTAGKGIQFQVRRGTL